MQIANRLIVIGTSTGGLNALHWLLAKLPSGLKATVLVVVHTSPSEDTLLDILSRHTQLPIRYAKDKDQLTAGVVLLAPPNRHMRIESRQIRIAYGPKENFVRPAIDPLFRSAAIECQHHVIGVSLPGDLEDGRVGMEAIKHYGGITLAQDPLETNNPFLENQAKGRVHIDYWLPVSQLATQLVSLVDEPIEDTAAHEVSKWLAIEEKASRQKSFSIEDLQKIGFPSPYGCPECHGVLYELRRGLPLRFRCHTGHTYTAKLLAGYQGRVAEEALWAAIRAFDEQETLNRRMAEQAANTEQVQHYRDIFNKAQINSARLREIILSLTP
jgi:two-component system chemotaxis response regulator CheB